MFLVGDGIRNEPKLFLNWLVAQGITITKIDFLFLCSINDAFQSGPARRLLRIFLTGADTSHLPTS